MIRIADLVAKIINDHAEIVFMVTGGGAMHLNDAFGKSDLKTIFCHHEQACAMAAESYSRISNLLSVVNVTTGPGGINALNGVFGAWTDSIPMLVVSGQVKRQTLVSTYGMNGGWRQLGDQEVNIIEMVKGITKYSVLIDDPKMIKYHLNKAIYLALTGRKGPTWIDIPIDIQSQLINEDELIDFDPKELDSFNSDQNSLRSDLDILIELIKQSKRPLIYAGSGIHSSDTKEVLHEIVNALNIPMVTAWNSNDLIEDNHRLYAGRPGTIGNRAGNFAVQSADLLIVLGSRLNIRLVSYNWESFAKNALKVGVDIDVKELNKPTCKFDHKFVYDLKFFLPELLSKIKSHEFPSNSEWINWCKIRLKKYPVCLDEYWSLKDKVNPYCFVDELSNHTVDDEIIICADGTACVTTFQGIRVKKNQRIFHNSGCASMGYELPATIGAYFTNPSVTRLICIAGDGSIMMNLQELQTIAGYNIPAQIFLLNNKGYHSIRQTQNSFFKGTSVGCGTESGLTFPDFQKTARAFDLNYFKIRNHEELRNNLGTIMSQTESFICELELDLNQQFSPKVTSKKLEDGSMTTSSLEDMWPFLSPNELESNIIRNYEQK